MKQNKSGSKSKRAVKKLNKKNNRNKPKGKTMSKEASDIYCCANCEAKAEQCRFDSGKGYKLDNIVKMKKLGIESTRNYTFERMTNLIQDDFVTMTFSESNRIERLNVRIISTELVNDEIINFTGAIMDYPKSIKSVKYGDIVEFTHEHILVIQSFVVWEDMLDKNNLIYQGMNDKDIQRVINIYPVVKDVYDEMFGENKLLYKCVFSEIMNYFDKLSWLGTDEEDGTLKILLFWSCFMKLQLKQFTGAIDDLLLDYNDWSVETSEDMKIYKSLVKTLEEIISSTEDCIKEEKKELGENK